ncbi:DUF523 domain-containing protein [Halodesulfovibrio marinisediminis]|uniref:Uncharacterized conserved protein YbbK, DUF523 family n=1 Tax=Halodesulfovibrio marinisediminis DSM 17456 TaxID=1121457 RepID=A0A1N6F5P3_9BACT|nr:DUF523 domain-containing protein [Halodesulfovibrio marinisediminis]SIN90603.1 Uncharacterized conserved protein YbbK, DUF523 family [Halodesulfovibrio marinisediminis DSM 17456]
MEYVVSACLAGCNCRYDGGNTANEHVQQLIREGRALPLCPEQLGGFPTPRTPFELKNGRAISKDGVDITEQMLQGVEEATKLVELAGCTKAILKSRSPSCGAGIIYDGSFSGVKIAGNGLFAERMLAMGLEVTCTD